MSKTYIVRTRFFNAVKFEGTYDGCIDYLADRIIKCQKAGVSDAAKDFMEVYEICTVRTYSADDIVKDDLNRVMNKLYGDTVGTED